MRAIHTPALLKRSGLANRNIGRHLKLHPVLVVFHIMGSARAGGSPETAACDPVGETWEVRNLLVLHGSSFPGRPPRGGTANTLALSPRPSASAGGASTARGTVEGMPSGTRTVSLHAVHARRRSALVALALLTAAAFAAGALVGASGGSSGGPNRLGAQPSSPGGPAGSQRRVAAAIAYAAARRGVVAFAVIDARGRLRGMNVRTPFIAASVVKAMLLVAELERLSEQRLPLDDDERDILARMIRESDNEAATSVYRRVGDPRLRALAARAGMGDGFRLGLLSVPACRCTATGWARAQITAGGQASFFRAFPGLVPARDRAFARSTLAQIVPEQRWGIPQEAPAGWQPFFKIGVRETGLGTAVHQAARLETSGKVVTLAVLTDGNPSDGYGKATVRGVARAIVGDATP